MARIQGRTAILPTPRPARALPRREALALVVSDGSGHLLLQRRPPTGVWGSLWSLPQFDEADARDAWMHAHLRADAPGVPLAPIEHTFSHYHLTLRPVALRAKLAPAVADGDLAWVGGQDARALGIPAPVRRLIETILED